jgi:secreted trypsin-like serine protease
MNKFLMVIVAVVVLAGCGPDPDMVMQTQSANQTNVQTSGRVTVTRIGVFRDDAAYNSTRGIYIITDTNTGQEYIGVSGIGISEMGSHSAGKARVTDER